MISAKTIPPACATPWAQDWDKIVVKIISYETTDATIDSQISELQGSGANVLLMAGIPKFAAQSIRKVYDLNWKPTFFMTNVSTSVGTVMQPAGPEKSVGMLSTQYLKDPTDPSWKDDPGMKVWRDVHGQVQSERRCHRCRDRVRLRDQHDHAAGAEAVRRRLLTRECHEAGGKPARFGESRRCCRDQDQHQRHRPSPHHRRCKWCAGTARPGFGLAA